MRHFGGGYYKDYGFYVLPVMREEISDIYQKRETYNILRVIGPIGPSVGPKLEILEEIFDVYGSICMCCLRVYL